ncbi:helix-turn-helix domain-containing protein [Desertivirga xinjiangensis]|uniref:helix-turn-helix domain-containing protein n=1 Tax=Desertivirga xinjiangensis TaxID=539206 RepID=UPI00210B403A
MQSAAAFHTYIEVVTLFSAVHIVAIVCNIGTPIGLLYGPLLYTANQPGYEAAKSKANFLIHFTPFLLFSVAYPFVFYGLQNSLPAAQTLMFYYPAYFASMFASLLYYTFSIMFARKKVQELHAHADLLITKLSVVNIANACLIILLMLQMFRNDINYGFDLRLLIYGLLACSLLLMLQYLYMRNIEADEETISADTLPVDSQQVRKRYQKSNLDEEVLDEYARRIHKILKESKLYLNSDLNPDMLSKETGIPRHHFSQLFNVQIGKSFYQLIAEYRIAHAVQVLNGEGNIKMESLAYECGFNSKTSFNRYFREQTGLTPSEYRQSGKAASVQSAINTN